VLSRREIIRNKTKCKVQPLTLHWLYTGATQKQSAARRYSTSVSADE